MMQNVSGGRQIKTANRKEERMNKIRMATTQDKEELLSLYHTMLYGPADWNEYYPNEDTIDFDLSRDALFVMENESHQIIAAISIDEDEAVEVLPCWNKEIAPGGELSRLCVRKDMQNKGIGKEMMRYAFDILKRQGKQSVHILVKTGHKVALSAYSSLGFQMVGECNLFEKDFICMERKL